MLNSVEHENFFIASGLGHEVVIELINSTDSYQTATQGEI